MKSINTMAGLVSIALVLGGCNLLSQMSGEGVDNSVTRSGGVNVDDKTDGMTESEVAIVRGLEADLAGAAANLKDVSGGSASGKAVAKFDDGAYMLLAEFAGLVDPTGTDFYEGWVVRKSPMSVVSTGRVEKVSGVYTNSFESPTDLSDHTRYVLTIEPDDGDPAPADHVLDGAVTLVK